VFLELNVREMKKERIKYVGSFKNEFHFINTNGVKMIFSKCRKDLIEEYKLDKEDSIDEWFMISYFEVKPLTLKEMDSQTLIISDIIPYR
jgi:hypothetical protein